MRSILAVMYYSKLSAIAFKLTNGFTEVNYRLPPRSHSNNRVSAIVYTIKQLLRVYTLS